MHPYISGEGGIEYHRTIADAAPELGIVLYVRDARITGEQIARPLRSAAWFGEREL